MALLLCDEVKQHRSSDDKKKKKRPRLRRRGEARVAVVSVAPKKNERERPIFWPFVYGMYMWNSYGGKWSGLRRPD
eukprot:scaffold2193_cov171-Amphora_coffeaeformis.AAC.4